ncbi:MULTISPECIES: DUF371 domain-containing protein [Thermococcus]|uniref:DUF371 domain-containing protein n=2 Tax=Thermococcus sibiricus TaxID=172049 RepID=C6A4W2_THESM|nr:MULTISPECIES: DUF371 domain-containing protein [Thermococcus]KUK29349.1 MAG: Uncharacterized protein XD61_0181 [Thermococcus sp. 40_45]HII67869.1 DUF371 domain-containing protein [Thermococcaceae archaeon]ACS90657.1 hypothetical protein TSIB_1606 [Thermococcus sibiricus MM 739]KUK16705.1 MAG: Uncharacterized protein XD54_2007 [Thermococcus sibiricus]MBC7094653.1 DUF371 domain-containing protein [Thermococcus sp.]
MLRERVTCYGHENVKATHRSTLEITKEDYLTPRGDCIICVKANKGLKELSDEIKEALKSGRKVKIRITADGIVDELEAVGDERLTFENEISMVIRKSEYVDGRTLAIRANKAARDIKRELVKKLRNPEQRVVVEIIVDD